MMLVCFVCSLPQDTYRGALLGCLVSLLLLEARTLALGATPLIMKLGSQHSLFAVVGIVLELSVLIPVMLALRWTINTQIDRFGEPLWSWERLRVPLGFLAAAVCVGGFLALYPADARHAINNTARLIDRGLAASNTAELPLPLRDESAVHDFLYYREATYTLELGEYTPLDIMLPGCQAI